MKNSNSNASYKISIEAPYDSSMEKVAIAMENSFNKFKSLINKTLSEVSSILNEFAEQDDSSYYIPNKYIEDHDFFGGVWFMTEYLEFNMVSFSENEGQFWSISLKDNMFENDMVSFYYDKRLLRNVKIDEGLKQIYDILNKISNTQFLDVETKIKMTIEG